MKEILVGYDIRFYHKVGREGHMDKKERDVSLLIPTIEWPLSVDTFVWPSLFMYEDVNINYQYKSTETIFLKARNFWQTMYMLWQDYEEMNDAIKGKKGALISKGVRIAVLVCLNEVQTNEFDVDNGYWASIKSSPLYGIELSKQWKLLGFDVADDGLNSGLSELGYGPDEKPELAKEWGHLLNEHGLIIELDDAMQFVELMNEREPGHAPFYSFALYSIHDDDLR